MSSLPGTGWAMDLVTNLTPKGPKVTDKQAMDAVAQLKTLARVSVPEVHKITGLDTQEAEKAHRQEVFVIDRPTWIEQAHSSLSQMIGPELLAGSSSVAGQLGASVAGLQMGTALSLLSTKILGQFDPFAAGAPKGRLLLVAPNIVEVAEELNVDLHDFSLWVCLHEQTHRVQFLAAPWIKDELVRRIDLLKTEMLGRGATLPSIEQITQATRKNSKTPAAEWFLGEQERENLSALTGIMSLLEGHANVVMDSVDASLIPSVRTIRRRFQKRAAQRSRLEKAILRLLGFEKKAAQYRDGQRFVQAVVDARGMDQFNRVFERPEHLPSEAEIHDPQAWMIRVLGPGPGEDAREHGPR